MGKPFLEHLDHVVSKNWSHIRGGLFWKTVESQGVSKALWRQTLTQIYHYTRHNSINQAVAAYRAQPDQVPLLRFVYKHADEELGHEQMVERDLQSLGVDIRGLAEQSPLPATRAFIAYLYHVALEHGPIPRLGYSFWAEDAYGHIGPLLATARRDLSLNDRNMTFFVAHSNIDAKHSVEVRNVIESYVQTPQQERAVIEVAETTLYLTGCILNNVAAEYLQASSPAEGEPAERGSVIAAV